MKKYWSTILFSFCLGMGAIAQPAIIDGVVAVVGKNIILKSDVDQQFESYRQQGLTDNESEKCRIFEDILFEKLLLHQAEIDSVEVSEEEVEGNLERRIQYFIQQFGSQKKMEQYYEKSIVEIKDEMEPLIRDQLTAQRMLGQVNGDVEITPTEVRQFFKKFPEDSLPLINAQVEYAQIVLYPVVSQEAKTVAVNRLREFKQSIEDGNSTFRSRAILYSEDPGSAKNGGLYEGIKRGQFVKEFEAVAFNLKENEISDPFLTEYGYHIVQLIKRRGEELDLRHILIKPKISQENLEVTRKKGDSIRSLILLDKLTFAQAAEKFSEDENSKLNGGVAMNPQSNDSRWETGQLDKSIFYTIEKLKPGEVSDPVFFRDQQSKEGFRLVVVRDKSQPHRADLKTDYQIIQNVALQEKKSKATQKWIEDKLSTTYVRVNNEYYQCSFQRNWIKRSQYVE